VERAVFPADKLDSNHFFPTIIVIESFMLTQFSSWFEICCLIDTSVNYKARRRTQIQQAQTQINGTKDKNKRTCIAKT
jgi:hypothetical protein